MAITMTMLLSLLFTCLLHFSNARTTYNILRFNAAGDGKTDDTRAFLEALQSACRNSRNPTVLLPRRRTFLLRNAVFWGPCRSSMRIKLDGKIVAPNWFWTRRNVNLLTFHSVRRLTVEGKGEIDGKGQIWWDCHAQKGCPNRPNLLAFLGCHHLTLKRITVKNSPNKQVTVYESNEVRVSRLKIIAPAESFNTDGILITASENVIVSNSIIGTGDDCIAIGPSSRNITIDGVSCGPGHGFSIGSLGGDGTRSVVRDVCVIRSTVSNSSTGVRIKTWQGGRGVVRNVLYRDIRFAAVDTPIVIDQYYCPFGNCQNKSSSVAIRDVRFEHLTGTSAQEVAIKVHCSRQVPCKGITMANVDLRWDALAGGGGAGGSKRNRKHDAAKSLCLNAVDTGFHSVNPRVRCQAG